MASTLSVCMITKNEEKNVKRCIDSIKHIADEIIVADTGSTDGTIEILKSLDVKIISHKWQNDFSKARNESLELATGDWILFLDADEEIEYNDGLKLKALLNSDNKYEAYYLRLINIIRGTNIGDSIVLRVFKNDRDYRFKGRMHEQVVNAIQDKHGLDSVGKTDIGILHYGYDPDVCPTIKKHERNVSILKTYPEEEKTGYYYYVLGNEYARVDDFENAIKIYNKALKLSDYKKVKSIYFPYLVLNIAKVYSNAKMFNEECKFIQNIRHLLPKFRDLYFMECLAQIECSRFSKAKECFYKYLNCPKGDYEFPNNNFENIYDLESLRIQLEEASINSSNNSLLSSLMFLDNPDESIIETVKSINEICSNVVVVIDKNINENIYVNKLRNIGAQILEISEDKRDKSFSFGLKQCKGKYVFLLKKNDICSLKSQKEIISTLSIGKYNAYNLLDIDMKTGEYSNNLRIIKNNKKLNSLDDYINELSSKDKVKDVPIYIHRKF